MAERRVIELPGGRRLHRWTDRDGQEWACMAYDHGPMCRLCQRVDETLGACLELVEEGKAEPRQRPAGEFEFKLTQKGRAVAEDVIGGSPEGAALWKQLQEYLEDR